jgi:hypothetical protein
MSSEPQKISEFYVVLGTNDSDVEGVACYVDPQDDVMKPLMGGLQKVPVLMQVAKALASESGRKLQLVKFSNRGNLDVFEP